MHLPTEQREHPHMVHPHSQTLTSHAVESVIILLSVCRGRRTRSTQLAGGAQGQGGGTAEVYTDQESLSLTARRFSQSGINQSGFIHTRARGFIIHKKRDKTPRSRAMRSMERAR